MLFYALVNQKYNSADKILEYINKANITTLKVGRNQMKPVAATVISPNFEYFKIMIEKEKTTQGYDFDSIMVEDSKLTHQLRSLVSYLCKKHRITKGKNEDIKQMFGFLRTNGYSIKKDEDKRRVFRQLIMSFNLDSEQADLDQIWSDYYGLVKEED